MKIENKIRKLYNDPAVGLVGIDALQKKLQEYDIDIDLDEL